MWIFFIIIIILFFIFLYIFLRICVVEKRGGPDPLDPPSGSAPASVIKSNEVVFV